MWMTAALGPLPLSQGTPLDAALKGKQGVVQGTDYRGTPVIAAFGPLTALDAALVLKINLDEIKGGLRKGLAKALDRLNLKMNRTEEMALGASSATNASQVDCLTQMKFADACGPGPCASDSAQTPFMDRAVTKCERGFADGYDYRGVPVAAAYRCIPELNAGFVLKVDEAQIRDDGIELTTEYVNLQNRNSDNTSMEIVLAERKNGVAAADVQGLRVDPPPPPLPRPMDTTAYGGKGQGKGKGGREGRIGQGGRGRGERPMGTTAYGGEGSKGRAANGDRPIGAASCRREQYTKGDMPTSHPPLVIPPFLQPPPPYGGGGVNLTKRHGKYQAPKKHFLEVILELLHFSATIV